METAYSKIWLVVIGIAIVLAAALGAITYKSCATPPPTVETHVLQIPGDTVRVPVDRWRTITQTVTNERTVIDTHFVFIDPGTPDAAPIGDTTFVRTATLVTPTSETPVEFREHVTVTPNIAEGRIGSYMLTFADAPLILVDTNVCAASVATDGHGFWTDVLYVLSGFGVGALAIAVLSIVK